MIESITLKKELIKALKPVFDQSFGQYNSREFLLKLPFFKNTDTIKFKPGLNILYGGNGTGKTTIMKILANALGCHQGGTSLYSRHWLHENLDELVVYDVSNSDIYEHSLPLKKGTSGHYRKTTLASVKHDGQFSYFCDPRKVRGLTYGGAAIDYDFIDDLKNSKSCSSTGEFNKERMNDIFEILSGKIDLSEIPKEILFTEKHNKKNIEEEAYLADVKEFITPTIPKGPLTILMDEPESALDHESLRNLFKLLKQNENREDLQIIMISHHPLVFSFENANYIAANKADFKRQYDLIKSGQYFNLDI